MFHLTNDQEVIFWEYMSWYFQVEWSGSLADTTRSVVVRTVAWTVVATKVTSIGNWHTTQMCAHTNHNKPFWALHSLLKNEYKRKINKKILQTGFKAFSFVNLHHLIEDHGALQVKLHVRRKSR